MRQLLTIKQASEWASTQLQKNVTTSNIQYLIQYGKVHKTKEEGITLIYKDELEKYYKSKIDFKKEDWKKKLGDDLNWKLSFSEYKESETTKHVHRLHAYKGKFIPQLVEYFLDLNTDNFKKKSYFKPGDIVLDPFCGSGTTLVQANELGMNALGIDISEFNTLISNCKIQKYDIKILKRVADSITNELYYFLLDKNNIDFEKELLDELRIFNNEHFPSPSFKHKLINEEINEKEYANLKEKEFLPIFNNLLKKYDIEVFQNNNDTFLDKWFIKVVRDEIDFVKDLISQIENENIKKILQIVLSRTIRSCRATTHSDLATLNKPIFTTYYCRKHRKICKPLFSILYWWKRYSKDTVKRILEFDNLRTDTEQICLTGDSRNIDILKELKIKNEKLYHLSKNSKINGIFSSPPYVGLIDYHEQHAYSYDLFGFERKDDLEIGPLFKGQGAQARKSYVEGISKVLDNSIKYLIEDFNIFLVANDKYNLYPEIAEKSGLKIVNTYKRPVLNRTEKDKSAYSEMIFHLKAK